MAVTSVRSQPGTIDYTGSDPAVARLFTLTEEMFEILFQDLKRVNDAAGTGSSDGSGVTIAQVAARVALGV